MFGTLTDRFQNLFSSLRGNKTFTEDNLKEAVREVRLALLEADVNYTVAGTFIHRIKEKVVGLDILKSVKAKDQFIKLIHDELIALMGGDESSLDIARHPGVVMLCGLQGSGKTTTAAKLALHLKKKGKKVLLAACDLERPAAVHQLQTLGHQIGVSVFAGEGTSIDVAKAAKLQASKEAYDVLIVDTAGRLHIDEPLMKELEELKKAITPHEVLFVANSATGQSAVQAAQQFDQRVSMTGTILTMLDGNSRAGAAISIREITGKPLKYEGVGERVEDFQVFNPASMADRILGMGDIINLVKKAEEHLDADEGKRLEKKLLKANFSFQDYLKQMNMIKKMGSFKGLLKMLPGASALGDFELPEKELGVTEAIILSMTHSERECLVELEPSRRRRIATGAGVSIDEVNRLIKGFKRAKQMMKNLPFNKLSKMNLS
ncbi:MAG: signal recognition particle protein [Simkaniaceae bacterium]|nr:signal recognition particle protein [Simkaniaceae bacterium]